MRTTKIKNVFIAGFLSFFAPEFASAADVPVKASVAAPVYDWTGWYFGANAGYAWGRSSTSSPLGEEGDYLYLPTVVNDINAQSARTVNSRGWTGGFQLGYNAQINNFVFGIETDLNAFHLKGNTTANPYFTGYPGPGVPPTYSNSVQTNWLFTARGRLGFTVNPTMLVYATGGLAVTDLKYIHSYAEGTTVGSPHGTELSTASKTKAGFVIGGGLEYALMNHWSVKAEYLYVNFGNVTSTGRIVFSDGGRGYAWPHSANLHASLARIGINHKF